MNSLDRHIGERFGYLIVKSVSRRKINKYYESFFVVECDCGITKEIRSGSVKRGNTNNKSCGCKIGETRSKFATTHGMSNSRLYRIYTNMKTRCLNDKCKFYPRYGGRGISIHEDWLNNFESFMRWSLESGYSSELTIERINNDGNYDPDNCTWIPMSEQHKNKTHNKNRGEKSSTSKLKESDIREIRFFIEKGYTMLEIGGLYGVSGATVCNIKLKQTWGHVK